MYKMSVTPGEVKRAEALVDTAKFDKDVEAVLRDVDLRLSAYVASAKENPANASSSKVVYSNFRVSRAVLEEACKQLTSQGFSAHVGHDPGYDDGPCSIHSSPPSDYLEVKAG